MTSEYSIIAMAFTKNYYYVVGAKAAKSTTDLSPFVRLSCELQGNSSEDDEMTTAQCALSQNKIGTERQNQKSIPFFCNNALGFF